LSKKADIPSMTKNKIEGKILSLPKQNANLRAVPIAKRNSESTRRKLLDEEKRLTTMIAIWPANVKSHLVDEHDMFFLNSMRTDRQVVMGCYDNELRTKVNRKAKKERAQILRKEKEVMRNREGRNAKREGTEVMRKMTVGSYNNKFRKKVNGKAERKRAQVLRKETKVMRKSIKKKCEKRRNYSNAKNDYGCGSHVMNPFADFTENLDPFNKISQHCYLRVVFTRKGYRLLCPL